MAGKQPKRNPHAGVGAHGRTPLHDAVADENVPRTRLLLRDRAGVNARDDDGCTALHFAAGAGHEELCRLLLDAGANPNLVDSYGNSPLLRAVFASRGRPEPIMLLRARGADPLATNKAGASPVSIARRIANYDVARYFADVVIEE